MLTGFENELIEFTVSGERLEIESVRGALAVGQLFQLFAHLAVASGASKTVQQLVGEDFVLTLNSRFGDSLSVHGLVASCQHHEDGDAEGYLLELCPHAHLRTLRRNHRVFQESTVRTIVSDLLTKFGTDVGPVEWAIGGTYPTRPYVAQTGETDWEFIERLLADEGIYYYFRFEERKTTLVFADDSPSASSVSGNAEIPIRDASQLTKEAAIVQSHHRWSVATDRVRLRDYEPRQLADVLDETVTMGSSWREYYSDPGGFSQPSDGRRRAKIIAEAFGSQRRAFSAHTNVLRLIPGYQFKLIDHDVAAHNIAYFVTGLTVFARRGTPHAARRRRKRRYADGLTLRVTAIPLDTPYRSPVPQPRVAPGPQTAVVVGPSGEEIHTDQYGQVRAQFYWDREGKRDQTASTPMRVGQFPLVGSMMLPRMHWDQLIGFTAGNVNAPVVLGHLYDSVLTVPYTLPDNQTRTAWQTATTPANGTSNEIRYEDKAGQEEVFLNASYDMTYEVGNDSSVTVGVDHTTEIGVNQTWKVGSNQSTKIDGKHEVSVGTAETLSVTGSRTTSIGGNDSATIGATRMVTATGGATLDAGGGHSLTAGTMMMTAATMGVERMVLGKASVTVGGAFISAAGAGMDGVTAGASTELIGGAKIQVGGGGISVGVKGKTTQIVGGALINSAGKSVTETSGADLQIDVGGAMVMAGKDVLIEAESKLVIKVGGTTLTMTKSKIHLKSPSLASPGATISKTGSTVSHNP